jgi:transposase
MLDPDDVCAMKKLWKKGWRIKQIVRDLGHGKNTVRRYVKAFERGLDAPAASPTPVGRPRGLAEVPPTWLKERLERHGGNADVVRQELATELGVVAGLRTVERAVAGFRQEIRAEVLATVRFETPPGKQIQVDFGTRKVVIAGATTRVHLCVLTLGYSRRIFVQAFRTEKQASWFTAIEGAFRHFGGVTEEILVDNARALVDHNDGEGNVTFNAAFKAFCDHWGVRPRACRPYRARTKGKDERAVQYVKRNALAGREFSSWDDLDAHLASWMRNIADLRVHQTTKEPPAVRFEKERGALLPVGGQRTFAAMRTWRRVVKSDTTIDVEGNAYSVPYRLIGKVAEAHVENGILVIKVDGELVASHAAAPSRSGARVIAPDHLKGVMRLWGAVSASPDPELASHHPVVGDSTLLRPLSEYEQLFDGIAAIGGAS